MERYSCSCINHVSCAFCRQQVDDLADQYRSAALEISNLPEYLQQAKGTLSAVLNHFVHLPAGATSFSALGAQAFCPQTAASLPSDRSFPRLWTGFCRERTSRRWT